jgi:GMP synthase PP-ATPase subunit
MGIENMNYSLQPLTHQGAFLCIEAKGKEIVNVFIDHRFTRNDEKSWYLEIILNCVRQCR